MSTLTLHEPRKVCTASNGLGPRPGDPIDHRAGDPLAEIELDDLTRHIVVCHHRYARETAALIEGWLDVLVARHAARHPELRAVRETFSVLARELLATMTREERLVFPAIHALAAAAHDMDAEDVAALAPIGDAIGLASREEAAIERLMTDIRMLTKRYRVPEDGCLTYRLCYEELGRFDADLARHVYLEKRILYPSALALGSRLP